VAGPRVLPRATFVYIDPRGPLADPALRFGEIEFKPSLFVYDGDLRETALKFKSQVENPGSMPRLYAEALGIVLTHELVRINGGGARREPANRGGLAAWQQKRVAAYIEEHVANDIPAATLAEFGAAEPVPFLPVVQEFLRHPAAPISRESPNRTCQAAIGKSRTVRHDDCARCWLRRHEQVQCRVS